MYRGRDVEATGARRLEPHCANIRVVRVVVLPRVVVMQRMHVVWRLFEIGHRVGVVIIMLAATHGIISRIVPLLNLKAV
jgi:hypothetical protein